MPQITEATASSTYHEFRAAKPKPVAGSYQIGDGHYNMRVSFSKKPRLFHRIMSRLLLGWAWEDAK